MKAVSFRLIVAATIIFLFGCSSNENLRANNENDINIAKENTNRAMQSWMGHDFNEVVASWGPPQQTMDDGKGGKIFTYIFNQQVSLPGSSMTLPVYTGNPYMVGPITTLNNPGQTINITKYRMFWINGMGKVYNWSWKGL